MGLLRRPELTSTMLTIAFRPVSARYLRLTLMAPSRYRWSMAELFVYEEGEAERSSEARATFWKALEWELDASGPERWRGVFNMYREALRLDPDLAEAHQRMLVLEERLRIPDGPADQRGLAFAQYRIWEEAIRPLQEAWDQSPRPIRGIILQPLAAGYEQLGETTRAAAVREALARLRSRRPMRVDFGPRLRLLGIDLEAGPARPGDRLRLGSVWHAVRPPGVDYDMVWYLQEERRRVRIAAPLAGTYPTSRWQSGEIVREETFLALPSDLPPGTYRLILRLQRPDSGQWTRIWRFGFPTLSRKLDLGEITVLSGS